jgi:hypothetical protein
VPGETKEGEEWTGEFACAEKCDAPFSCGVHRCTSPCHPHTSSLPLSCPRSPELVKTCPCGKTPLRELPNPERRKCTDKVPTCREVCGKVREECGHACLRGCHEGECGSCTERVPVLTHSPPSLFAALSAAARPLAPLASVANAMSRRRLLLRSREWRRTTRGLGRTSSGAIGCASQCAFPSLFNFPHFPSAIFSEAGTDFPSLVTPPFSLPRPSNTFLPFSRRQCGRHQCNRVCCPLAWQEALTTNAGKKGKRRAMSVQEEIAEMEAQDPLGIHRCDRTCGRKLNCAFFFRHSFLFHRRFTTRTTRPVPGSPCPVFVLTTSLLLRRYPQLRASRPQRSLSAVSSRRFRRVRFPPSLSSFLASSLPFFS